MEVDMKIHYIDVSNAQKVNKIYLKALCFHTDTFYVHFIIYYTLKSEPRRFRPCLLVLCSITKRSTQCGSCVLSLERTLRSMMSHK